MPVPRPLSSAGFGILAIVAVAQLRAQLPPIRQIFPAETNTNPQPAPTQGVDFYLDGTLSMRGYAHAGARRFPQLLQDLDLALSGTPGGRRLSYYRFGGSTVEKIAQRPFYIAASEDRFYQSGAAYQKTEIERVFRRAATGRLTLVMTDLFEQDLDINAVEQSLDGAHFPEASSLAVWQWNIPFDGLVYDYDFRARGGRPYRGNRYLYLLALGAKASIEQLQDAIARTVTAGAPKFLLLSRELTVNAADWIRVTQLEKAALKSRTAENVAVYRLSRGCEAAEFTMPVRLTPASYSAVAISFPGTYDTSLFAIGQAKQTATHTLTNVEANATRDKAGNTLLHVRTPCAAVVSASTAVLRIRRVGSDADVRLPDWVAQSSASTAEFNAPANLQKPDWGDRTLNLTPFLRELAAKATRNTTMATGYLYLTAD